MTAPWTWKTTSPAERDLKRLDRQVREQNFDALDKMAASHPQASSVIRLHGVEPPQYRLRVGDWRVRFYLRETERQIVVLRVLHRREAYR